MSGRSRKTDLMTTAAEITRKNRTTGTTITARNDGFHGWITICEDHGQFAEHPNRKLAVSWMAEPTVWCTVCQQNHN